MDEDHQFIKDLDHEDGAADEFDKQVNQTLEVKWIRKTVLVTWLETL